MRGVSSGISNTVVSSLGDMGRIEGWEEISLGLK